MALDPQTRRAYFNVGLPWGLLNISPSGTIDFSDRAAILDLIVSVSLDAPADVGPEIPDTLLEKGSGYYTMAELGLIMPGGRF